MPTPTVINKYRYSDVINRRYWDKYIFSNMSVNPTISKVGGGAAAGGSGETDTMNDTKTILEYYNIVGNAKLGPQLDGSFGLDLSSTATSTHGVEYNTGVTPQNNFTFLIDTSGATTPAFFLRTTLKMATAAGATIELGFRKLQANNATFTSYTDYATIGVIAGEFEINTQIASGGAVITDTTQAPADATAFEIAVFVDSMGNVTYQINGQPPVVTAAYQFANALTVMPFLRIVQNATTTATVSCNYFECGFQS
jgi:hypothetical protein